MVSKVLLPAEYQLIRIPLSEASCLERHGSILLGIIDEQSASYLIDDEIVCF